MNALSSGLISSVSLKYAIMSSASTRGKDIVLTGKCFQVLDDSNNLIYL
jgi:hypothetical protein